MAAFGRSGCNITSVEPGKQHFGNHNNIQAESNVRFIEGDWRLLNYHSHFVEGWDVVRGIGILTAEMNLPVLMETKPKCNLFEYGSLLSFGNVIY